MAWLPEFPQSSWPAAAGEALSSIIYSSFPRLRVISIRMAWSTRWTSICLRRPYATVPPTTSLTCLMTVKSIRSTWIYSSMTSCERNAATPTWMAMSTWMTSWLSPPRLGASKDGRPATSEKTRRSTSSTSSSWRRTLAALPWPRSKTCYVGFCKTGDDIEQHRGCGSFEKIPMCPQNSSWQTKETTLDKSPKHLCHLVFRIV